MVKELILKFLKFYQIFISPNLGRHCRFWPSCSEYTYETFRKEGLPRASWKSFKRIVKCGPWNRGGIDLP
ncbi:MAG: membrane protein insertion efficiency factor YidD [Candidatus Nealsonbacteria bacterium CG_4_9_14_0_2_um_filter_37_38]|uniref:Putative membrane protein insertion efficiency factor n=1 Tax=Candidatus Nealsonbacteria bacterium CG_4_10_14_0_8_um_filter_37_14 TaxID=1974684 RepID=A0A2M7R7N0_9BACT|nr:MAG: membrane protein insertion efficiency factor YidD [Candidatus Nealsonbacteria bacterium CG11_big_fil_rev_8_21_14_0_20_37_68]PIW92183.1 MAG: membrane protein insertion efficiency factor YidD [Candidatus Nealsonbacteria bacterium CG_4_8_14_3_um_filter_37_23]PIY89548.1 MAG: membrane protein insertion efficiency factor YidD [Candidatus Nealsonbacteria bacterium CG_4_10_14_0_8_um_filter_37_14]PJC51407.1 MAG: membrane protein insertion efficiency factor YidD [Candidatus Nealsonbacteria bacteri